MLDQLTEYAINYYRDFGRLDALFADPALARVQHHVAAHVPGDRSP